MLDLPFLRGASRLSWAALLLAAGCSTGGGGGATSTGASLTSSASVSASSGGGTSANTTRAASSGGSSSGAGSTGSSGASTRTSQGGSSGAASTSQGSSATASGTTGGGSSGSTGSGSSGSGGGFSPGDGGVPPSPVQPGVSLPCTVTVGTGSGALSYPTLQTTLNLADGAVVCIAAGTYTSGSFSGASATSSPITIENAPGGTVTFTGTLSLSDLHNVVFSGAGTAGVLTGISVGNTFADDVDITGPLDTFTFQNVALLECQRYGIWVNDDSLVYQAGNPATYFHDLTFKNLTATGIVYTPLQFGPTSAGLAAADGGFVSITENLEIANCDFGNMNPGSILGLDDVQGCDIHGNRFLDLNTTLTNHDNLIFLAGYGDVHDNYANNYQGEGIRIWPFGVSGATVTNFYNNINLGSLKYSAIEFQPQAPFLDVVSIVSAAGKVATLNAYNNTAGNLDLGALGNPSECGNTAATAFWYSGLIDVYDNGTVNLTNNLAFNTLCPNDTGTAQANPATYGGHLINYEGNILPTFTTNLYYPYAGDAGLANDLGVQPLPGSPVLGAGTPVAGLTTDFYGNPRPNPPSVGAVE